MRFVGVNILLDGPCEMSGSIKWPGFPPTLVAVTGGAKNDVLDQPDDEPEPGEVLHLYVFNGVGYLDYRGKNRHLSGKYGFYALVPEGEYTCVKCGVVAVSPPTWPFERCTHWQSGFHEIEVTVPAVMEMDHRAR